eukprot:403334936
MQTLDKSVLISSENPQKNPSSKAGFSKRKVLLSTCAAVALGLIVNQTLTTQVKSVNNELVKNGFLQSLWMDQPQSDFTWRKIPSLQVDQSSSKIIDITISTSGDIYGTVSQQIFDEEVKRGYLYSASSSNWFKAFSKFQFEGIRFDNHGNFHLLDQNNNVYAKNDINEIILNNIHDFQISSSNVFHAITERQMVTHFGNDASGVDLRLYSVSYFKKVQLLNDEPLLLNQNGSLSGYTNYHECLSDFSVGIDRSIWALNCSQDNSTGSELLKWNSVNKTWDLIEGIKGVKISAYNEISVAVLDVFGDIFLSQINKGYVDPSLPEFINSSSILNDTAKLSYVLGLLPQDQGNMEAQLCYRHNTSQESSSFHKGCDRQGPTLVVGLSTNGTILGGYASQSWTSPPGNTPVQDKDAFIFSYDFKVKLLPDPLSPRQLLTYADFGPRFGVNDLGFGKEYMEAGPISQYLLPKNVSEEARMFWNQGYILQLKTFEVFILKK